MSRLAAVVAVVLGLSASAAAQPYAPPPPPPVGPPPPYAPPPPPAERSGFTIGVGLGFGSLELRGSGENESYATLVFDLHLGGMLNSRTALLVDLFGGPAANGDSSESDVELSHSNIGIAIQYWLRQRLWLRGGFATARLEAREFDTTVARAEGPTLFVGGGYELVSRPNYALDLALRIAGTFYRDDDFDDDLSSTTGALSLGFSWY